ncbi:MAG: AtpZ/AtpI family protein [Atribacterota bacterium]
MNRWDKESIFKDIGILWDLAWMTVSPVLLGIFVGQYLDRHYFLGFSWTLSLLVLGAILGFYNLYEFLMKESRKMGKNGLSNDKSNDR